MNQQFLLYRLINGYYYSDFHGKKFKVVTPTAKIKYEANIYFNKIQDEIKYHERDDWLSEIKRQKILSHFGIWNNTKQQRLEELEKNQEELKLGLFLGFNVKKTKELFEKELQTNRRETLSLYNCKDTYKDLTKSFFLLKCKNHFLLKHTVYLRGRLFFRRKDTNPFVLDNFLSQYSYERIFDKIPKLIRSYEWSNYWTASKGRLIGNPTKDLNDEQLFAINSNLSLDSIRKHPECPNSYILDNPDATEGWVISQSRKRERDAKLQKAENALQGKNKEAGEVYFMADKEQTSKEIHDLNDPASKQFIKEMEQFADQELGKGKKKIDWVDIPAVQKRKMREKEGRL
jgi:hypothetical protein